MTMALTQRDIDELVARNIKRARLEADMTEQALADFVGPTKTPKDVWRWETGLHRPKDDALLKIAEATGHDYAWFFVDHDADETSS